MSHFLSTTKSARIPCSSEAIVEEVPYDARCKSLLVEKLRSGTGTSPGEGRTDCRAATADISDEICNIARKSLLCIVLPDG